MMGRTFLAQRGPESAKDKGVLQSKRLLELHLRGFPHGSYFQLRRN
jgi:hypothetical protein